MTSRFAIGDRARHTSSRRVGTVVVDQLDTDTAVVVRIIDDPNQTADPHRKSTIGDLCVWSNRYVERIPRYRHRESIEHWVIDGTYITLRHRYALVTLSTDSELIARVEHESAAAAAATFDRVRAIRDRIPTSADLAADQ